MESKADQLSERLPDYAAETVRVPTLMSRTAAGRHITSQLLRSGTSAGANDEEACGAQSRADFVHKLQIVLKELRESRFWLRLARKAGLSADDQVPERVKETGHVITIVARPVITAKNRN